MSFLGPSPKNIFCLHCIIIYLRGAKSNYEDDISVLVLTEEIDLTAHPHIKPVCLPTATGARPEEGW